MGVLVLGKDVKYRYPTSMVASIKGNERFDDVVATVPKGQSLHIGSGEYILSDTQVITKDLMAIGGKGSGFYVNSGQVGLRFESNQVSLLQNLRFRAREGAIGCLVTDSFDGHLSFENCKFERMEALFVNENLERYPTLVLSGKGSIEFHNCEIDSVLAISDELSIAFHNCKVGSFKEIESALEVGSIEIYNSQFKNVVLKSKDLIKATTMSSSGEVSILSDAEISELVLEPLNELTLLGKKPEYLLDRMVFLASEDVTISIGVLNELKQRRGTFPSRYLRFMLVRSALSVGRHESLNEWLQFQYESNVSGPITELSWLTNVDDL